MRRLATLTLMLAVPGFAHALDLTPAQTEGPYYPRAALTETDSDLNRFGGAQAKGETLVLDLRVVDPDGKPIGNARVEIWQTDHQGIYLHPGDPNVRRRDSAFQGYGAARSDSDGRVRFTTIMPPPYEGRPAHIHAKITPPGGATLTTQFYFAGDPVLARDGIVRRLGKALELVTLRTRANAGNGQQAELTVVVRRAQRRS